MIQAVQKKKLSERSVFEILIEANNKENKFYMRCNFARLANVMLGIVVSTNLSTTVCPCPIYCPGTCHISSHSPVSLILLPSSFPLPATTRSASSVAINIFFSPSTSQRQTSSPPTSPAASTASVEAMQLVSTRWRRSFLASIWSCRLRRSRRD